MRTLRAGLWPVLSLAATLSAQSSQPLAPMAQARSRFAAATVGRRSVLVAGGTCSPGDEVLPTATVEALDCGSGRFRTVAPMITPRRGQALVRLMDGRVLALGGFGQTNATPGPNPGIVPPHYGPLASAELFDPYPGRWYATEPMRRSREDVAAAQAGDGRVLVVGEGRETEWFDPFTESFTPGPLLHLDHLRPVVMALPDGRLLVMGMGPGVTAADRRAEVVDPAAGTSTPTAPMVRSRRGGFSATLLKDGRVLVAGGEEDTREAGTLEVFDPRALAFQLAPFQLGTDRRDHSATLLPDGRVALAGGLGVVNRVPGGATGAVPPIQGVLADAEVVDLEQGRAVKAGPLAEARTGHGAVLAQDGGLILFGGSNQGGPLASAEKLSLR